MADNTPQDHEPGAAGGGRRGLGLTTGVIIGAVLVVAIGGPALVACIGVSAAIAIPNFVAMQLKAKRAEVPSNVDGIRVAELAYDAAFDVFVPVGSEEEARRGLGKGQRQWEGGRDWDQLGWSADGPIRGGYWVEVHGTDFTVHGICDVDGDGDIAEYSATSSLTTRLETDPNTY